MTETGNIKKINEDKDNVKKDKENTDNNVKDFSNKKEEITKNTIFIVITLIILLSSFLISAILASKNYEEIFNFIKNTLF
ncbi:hypothetical protein [Senegalia massiliensis]|jgi:ABC-type lipoprotein release transport system permease subunit|uniref:hypothetical protein n=1 Tax=Senegalia massiliensis TaxID=1720316 RepID=UPI00102F3676|nr:hypothetical protein [Senegalia massiliensis]